MSGRRRSIGKYLIPVAIAVVVIIILILVRTSVGEATFDNKEKVISFKNITTQTGGMLQFPAGETEAKTELTGGSRLHLMICTMDDALVDETIEESGSCTFTLPEENSYAVVLEGDKVSGTVSFAPVP